MTSLYVSKQFVKMNFDPECHGGEKGGQNAKINCNLPGPVSSSNFLQILTFYLGEMVGGIHPPSPI